MMVAALACVTCHHCLTTGLQCLPSVCMGFLCVTEEVCLKTVYSRGLTPLLQGQLAFEVLVLF